MIRDPGPARNPQFERGSASLCPSGLVDIPSDGLGATRRPVPGEWAGDPTSREVNWMLRGECRKYPKVNFFPVRGENATEAKQVCAGCPVVDECQNFAIEAGGGHVIGVWGGCTEKEFRTIRASLRRQLGVEQMPRATTTRSYTEVPAPSTIRGRRYIAKKRAA